MHNMRKLLMVALVLICLPAISAAQSQAEIVSEVNGVKITRADLDKQQGNKLLQARYQYFLAEQKALDELIDQRLIDFQANKENLSVEALMKREVVDKIKDPTEDQLQVYYEGLNSTQPYEQVRENILNHIRGLRGAKLRAAYVEQLRAKADILITLSPPSADFELGSAFRQGPESATVTIVEFADYECPYCSKVHPELKKLRSEFGDRLSLAFKDFPLSMHAKAQKAAEASRCAGAQGKFWEYHDVLFSSKELEVPQLKRHAREMNLDVAKFESCLDSGETAAAVKKDQSEALKLGLTGTPSFFINGHFFSGAVDYATLRDMVMQQLAKQKAGAKEVSRK